MGKTINLLSAASDATAANNFQLLPICNPATGISSKMTQAQAKGVYQTFKKKYVATGSEGNTLTISELSGKEILMATREGSVMYETSSGPDSVEFTFDGTNITLGLTVGGPGERFLFLYKTPL